MESEKSGKKERWRLKDEERQAWTTVDRVRVMAFS